jgi:DNA (cytosine-5)-methyltransferase 1
LDSEIETFIPVVFDELQITSAANRSRVDHQVSPTLNTAGKMSISDFIPVVADPITSNEGHTYSHAGNNAGKLHICISQSMGIRRLTPRECERLQGFSDDHTLIPYRGKPASDAPRYKAIGNSMAVNVMRWIGRRIADVDNDR